MTEPRAAYEAATIEAMHTGDCTALAAPEPPDLEYTYDAPRLDLVPVRADELARLRADNAKLCVQLEGWNTIPAEELIAYWDAHGDGDDALGDWIGELRRGVNVGRYYAGLEPL